MVVSPNLFSKRSSEILLVLLLILEELVTFRATEGVFFLQFLWHTMCIMKHSV
jgi:hypothetical protein